MGVVLFLNSIFVNKFYSVKIKLCEKISSLIFKTSYILRWWIALEEERKRKNIFRILSNTGCIKDAEILLNVKRLFSKQLPNMPKSYITRLIFDVKHRTVVLQQYIKKKIQIIGGCTYRTFKRQQLIELVFFAISTSYQIKGYGSLLMSFLKEKARSLNLKIIITCADNNAVNYFRKQGFSPIITSPIFAWAGYICNYEEIVLMECLVFQYFRYYNFFPLLFTQKIFVLIKSVTLIVKNNNILMDKHYCFRSSFFNLLANVHKQSKVSKFYKILNGLLNEIKFNHFADPFLEPVNSRKYNAKNYFNTVFNAIDLRTIEERLKVRNYYNTKQFLIENLRTMVKNCIFYNGKRHVLFENCYKMEKIYKT
nr:HAT [Cryptomonas sp.]